MLTQHLRAARQTSQAGWGNFNGIADDDASWGKKKSHLDQQLLFKGVRVTLSGMCI